jgi:phage-related protein
VQTPKFNVEFLEEASDFLDGLDQKVRDKIIYNITKARFSYDPELFKKLNNEIWEFRTLYNQTCYRLFAFWDKSKKTDTVVITTHGLVKKTNKIPKTEIDRAERLRKAYFEFKAMTK